MQHCMRRASAFFFCRSPGCVICVFVCPFDSCRWESAFASRFLVIAPFFSPCYITFFPCIRGGKGDNMNCLAVLSVFFFPLFYLRASTPALYPSTPLFSQVSPPPFPAGVFLAVPQPFFKAFIMTKTTGWFLFFCFEVNFKKRKKKMIKGEGSFELHTLFPSSLFLVFFSSHFFFIRTKSLLFSSNVSSCYFLTFKKKRHSEETGEA